MEHVSLHDITWERMLRAVEKVRQRLDRAVAALEAANIPYAVLGGNAVAAWVLRVDVAAVRNTQDVDILIQRSDFSAVKRELEAAGFVHRSVMGVEMLADSEEAKTRDAIHLVFAGEKVRPEHVLAAPNVTDSEQHTAFRVVQLNALVRMKLTAFRDKDRTHLRDLIEIGLLDESHLSLLPPQLAPRLQELLDNPDG